MKLLASLSTLLGLAACTGAQYFSQGWEPGQPIPTVPAYAQKTIPSRPRPTSAFSFVSAVKGGLKGGADYVSAKMGVNLTERLVGAGAEDDAEWDPRVPLITDENYGEVFLDGFDPQDQDQVWFLIVSVTKGGKNPYSKLADKHFDEAYNISQIEGDLPYVQWGRIDYLNVTYITTKWSIWQGPMIVVAADGGQSLWFYNVKSVNMEPQVIRDFLKAQGWRNAPAWDSPFAPGHSWEPLMHYYGLGLKYLYDFLVRVPKWALMIGSGIVGQFAMQYLHKRFGTDTTAAPPARPKPAPAAKPDTATADAAVKAGVASPATVEKASPSPAKSKAKQRKNARK